MDSGLSGLTSGSCFIADHQCISGPRKFSHGFLRIMADPFQLICALLRIKQLPQLVHLFAVTLMVQRFIFNFSWHWKQAVKNELRNFSVNGVSLDDRIFILIAISPHTSSSNFHSRLTNTCRDGCVRRKYPFARILFHIYSLSNLKN